MEVTHNILFSSSGAEAGSGGELETEFLHRSIEKSSCRSETQLNGNSERFKKIESIFSDNLVEQNSAIERINSYNKTHRKLYNLKDKKISKKASNEIQLQKLNEIRTSLKEKVKSEKYREVDLLLAKFLLGETKIKKTNGIVGGNLTIEKNNNVLLVNDFVLNDLVIKKEKEKEKENFAEKIELVHKPIENINLRSENNFNKLDRFKKIEYLFSDDLIERNLAIERIHIYNQTYGNLFNIKSKKFSVKPQISNDIQLQNLEHIRNDLKNKVKNQEFFEVDVFLSQFTI